MSNTKSSPNGKLDYGQKIIEMINETEDLDYLEFIYNMMTAFRKKWGV